MKFTFKMASELNIQDKFRLVCKQILESLSSMISDAKDAKLTKVQPNQVNMALTMLSTVDSSALVVAFIGHAKLWQKIIDKNVDFLLEGIPQIFSEVPISPEVLIEPIIIYKRLLSEGFKGKKDPNIYPINQEDIDGLWKRFELLIKAACKYNIENGKKYNLSAYEEKYGLK